MASGSENQLVPVDVDKAISEISKGMFDFSESMILLHESYIKDQSKWKRDVKGIRNSLSKDTKRYVFEILPKYKQIFDDIDDYCDIYNDATFDEWRQYKKELTDLISKYVERIADLRNIHDSMLTQFKITKVDANKLKNKVSSDQKQLERDIEKARTKVEEMTLEAAKYDWIPFFGGYLAQGYHSEAATARDTEQSKSVEKEEGDNALQSVEQIIKALTCVTAGLDKLSSFYIIIQTLLEKSERSGKQKAILPSQGKFHFGYMERSSPKIKQMCMQAQAKLPVVETNFKAIM